MARQDAIDYKKGRAFDAAEEEGGAEGEDDVGDAQRVLHRRHGLRVVGRHPPLHRLHRSAAGGGGDGDGDVGRRSLCPNPRPRAGPPSHAGPPLRRRNQETNSDSQTIFARRFCRNGTDGEHERQGQGMNERKKAYSAGAVRSLAFERGNLRPRKQAEAAGAGKLERLA